MGSRLNVTFLWIILGLIIFFWTIKQVLLGSGILAKIAVSVIILIFGFLLLRLITGLALFMTFAKVCASILVVALVANMIKRLFVDD